MKPPFLDILSFAMIDYRSPEDTYIHIYIYMFFSYIHLNADYIPIMIDISLMFVYIYVHIQHIYIYIYTTYIYIYIQHIYIYIYIQHIYIYIYNIYTTYFPHICMICNYLFMYKQFCLAIFHYEPCTINQLIQCPKKAFVPSVPSRAFRRWAMQSGQGIWQRPKYWLSTASRTDWVRPFLPPIWEWFVPPIKMVIFCFTHMNGI